MIRLTYVTFNNYYKLSSIIRRINYIGVSVVKFSCKLTLKYILT